MARGLSLWPNGILPGSTGGVYSTIRLRLSNIPINWMSLLSAGMSVNMYMFHGGTTRGFMNGANCYDTGFYEPQVSSYDYDAPLDEAGNATPKFMLFRKAIQKNLAGGAINCPKYRQQNLRSRCRLLSFRQMQQIFFRYCPHPYKLNTPLTFEALKQPYGFVLYRTQQTGGKKGCSASKSCAITAL